MNSEHHSSAILPEAEVKPRHGDLAQVNWADTGRFYPLDDPKMGVEVIEGNADIFVVTDHGWYPLGTLSAGSYLLGCATVSGWTLAVRRAAQVSLRSFEVEEKIRESMGDTQEVERFSAGLEMALSNLSLEAVIPRELPPRDFDVLSPGTVKVRRMDVLRPIDSWIWMEASDAVKVNPQTLEGENLSKMERSWLGLGKHDWIQGLQSVTLEAITTSDLLARGLLTQVWGEHARGLLYTCREGVRRQKISQRRGIEDAARAEHEKTRDVVRANRRLARGDGSDYEFGEALGPWATAMVRSIASDGHTQLPSRDLGPVLRAATSFDDVALIGWVRVRALKLIDGWWRTPQANSFVTTYGPDKLPCTVTFKRKYPWIQLWSDDEGRPLHEDDLAALNPDARIVEAPLPPSVKTLRGLFKFGLKGSAADIAALLVSAALVMILSITTPVVSGQVIGSLVELGGSHVIIQIGGVLLVLAMLTAALQTVQNHLALRIKGRMTQRVGAGVWGKLLSLPLSFFEKRSPGALGSIILNIRMAQETVSGAVVTSALSLTVAIADLMVLIAVAPSVGASVGLILLLVTSVILRLFAKDVASQKAYLSREQEVSGLMMSVLSAMPKIRAAGVEQRVLTQWGRIQRGASRYQIVSRRLESWVIVITSVLMPIVVTVVVVVGSVGGEITRLITAIIAAQLLITNYMQFVTVFQILAPVLPMYGFLRPILTEPPECGETRAQPGELSGDIRFHEVSFRYGVDGPVVLDKVSLTVKRGEFVAFVGPSGAGKSTLLRLLIGFDRPCSGSVLYDGQDLSELDVAAVRRQCGIVLQDNGTISGSIRDNICGSGNYTDAEVWEAAEMAGMAEDIQAMPMKLGTMVTNDLSGLSGGQRQRLMIARALISRPRIVVFDEATSALDNPTQAAVTESVRRLNATRIVVAHRLSTVRDADRIVVVDQGRIVESGTFDELLALDGVFRRMANAQRDEAEVPQYA